MAKTTVFVVIPKNIPVPVGLIAFCKRYSIPLMRGAEVGPDSGWKIPGMNRGTAPCVTEDPAPEEVTATKCFHRSVFIDYENGIERCDSGCGHVFRTFPPVKHSCPEVDGVCRDKCMAEMVS